MDTLHVADPKVRAGDRDWIRVVSAYSKPDVRRSVVEILLTVVPLAVLWSAAAMAYTVSIWFALPLAVLASGFLLRMFLIQHDCGHMAFFESRRANDWVGRAIGVLTLTPYDVWRRDHALHHAGSGNLDRRGVGDIDTLTVDEFKALSPFEQWRYRLYRHPFVLFALGPTYVFVLQQRLPFGQMRDGWRPWVSAMGTNVAIALLYGGLIALVGLEAFLVVTAPVVLVAATVGIWLFYVQHQFEETHWAASDAWSRETAALAGSSYYDLPGPLGWFTANIGIHHVHHLYSRVPFYRLPEVLRDHPELADMQRIAFLEGFKTTRLKLWDVERQRLVSFQEAGV
ncbi:MAG: fatty acid desaturase [Hyphomicrobiaceae bacterium]|nr:fatty acid desaturase [Hyphomicrobiaceae bacterium]